MQLSYLGTLEQQQKSQAENVQDDPGMSHHT